METRELVVLGGGPGGYAAAFHAAELGMKVTLVDKAPDLGGVCLLVGCIPSKALLHVAQLINEAREAKSWGVTFEPPKIDLDRLREWKSQVVGRLAGGVEHLCRRRGVELIKARATFADSQTLALEGEGAPAKIQAKQIILSSGSHPVIPPPLRGVEDARIMTSTQALDLPEVPRDLLVVGGGYIGLELATVYAALGSHVTIAEMTGGLLPGADRDLVKLLQKRLEKEMHGIYLSTRVERLEPQEPGILVELQGPGVEEQQLFGRVLIAAGRRPNSQGLGIEMTNVELDDDGFVKIDTSQRTTDDHIFAIGDVAGEPMLAHKASRQGKVAAEAAAGMPARFDNLAIPAVVFTDPEVAWCGMTETDAEAQGIELQVARFPWSASGRAHTMGRTDGLTKILFEPQSERVLGVGIVGAGAGELISEGVLAVEMGAVARDMADVIHTHPTLSETVGESAESLFGEATHLYTRRR
jgi:dihydrolipoamide dehydrogenase